MQFDESRILEALVAEWRWAIPRIKSVTAVSFMGNVILIDDEECCWRICPEELSAEVVARNSGAMAVVFADPETKTDWQMAGLVSDLVEAYGEPSVGECFGLVIPGVIGGDYSMENIRRRSVYEYLRFTGDIARQIEDLKEGETIKFALT